MLTFLSTGRFSPPHEDLSRMSLLLCKNQRNCVSNKISYIYMQYFVGRPVKDNIYSERNDDPEFFG